MNNEQMLRAWRNFQRVRASIGDKTFIGLIDVCFKMRAHPNDKVFHHDINKQAWRCVIENSNKELLLLSAKNIELDKETELDKEIQNGLHKLFN